MLQVLDVVIDADVGPATTVSFAGGGNSLRFTLSSSTASMDEEEGGVKGSTISANTDSVVAFVDGCGVYCRCICRPFPVFVPFALGFVLAFAVVAMVEEDTSFVLPAGPTIRAEELVPASGPLSITSPAALPMIKAGGKFGVVMVRSGQ